MLEIGSDGVVVGTAAALVAEDLTLRGRFTRSPNRLCAVLGKGAAVVGGRHVYLLQTPEGVARLTAPCGLRSAEVEWTVETARLEAMPWVAAAVTHRASAFFGWVHAGGDASRAECARAQLAYVVRWRSVTSGTTALGRQLDVMAADLHAALHAASWTVDTATIEPWPLEDGPTVAEAWHGNGERIAPGGLMDAARRLARMREAELGRLRPEHGADEFELHADHVEALRALGGVLFPGDRAAHRKSGAFTVYPDRMLGLGPVEALEPVGALFPVGRVAIDFEHVRARFGDPAEAPGGAIALVTPAGVARVAWDERAGVWVVAGPSLDIMPWVLAALTGSTAGLAWTTDAAGVAARKRAAVQLAGAFAAFIAARWGGQQHGPAAAQHAARREAMAADLVGVLRAGAVARVLSDVAQRWERARAEADDAGVRFAYAEPLATVRVLAALAGSAE